MGAKNHCVVLPDANKNKTLSQITGAAFGAAGQRCMALSMAIFVGRSKEWIPELVEAAKKLKVNAGHVPGTDLGPVISPQAKQRINELIESGVKEGAKLSLDGRGIVVSGFENGNFVGPTVLTDVKVKYTNSSRINKSLTRRDSHKSFTDLSSFCMIILGHQKIIPAKQ